MAAGELVGTAGGFVAEPAASVKIGHWNGLVPVFPDSSPSSPRSRLLDCFWTTKVKDVVLDCPGAANVKEFD